MSWFSARPTEYTSADAGSTVVAAGAVADPDGDSVVLAGADGAGVAWHALAARLAATASAAARDGTWSKIRIVGQPSRISRAGPPNDRGPRRRTTCDPTRHRRDTLAP
jgi:hypothetical protein